MLRSLCPRSPICIATMLLALFFFGATLLESQTSDADQHSRCGTPHLLSLVQTAQAESDKERASARLENLLSRPALQESIVSPKGHFRIHFDRTGQNAPPLFDGNANGIPDFVDSVAFYMDEAWRVQVEECGFTAPPADGVRSGPANPDSRLDVFLEEQNGEFYGLAFPSGKLSPIRESGFLVIDNDFAEFQTSGIAGVKVTTAHELFHLVQFAGYRGLNDQASLYESTATYMEYKVHPEESDYLNYVNRLLGEPEAYPFSTNDTRNGATGYAHSMYIQFLVQRAGEEIVRAMWEEFGRTGLSFEAINQSLLASGKGLNLSTTYCDFAKIMYLAGSTGSGADTLPELDRYRRIEPATTRTLGSDEQVIFSDALSPLTFGVWRVVIPAGIGVPPDTLDFLVTNSRSDIGVGGLQWKRNPESFNLTVSRTSGADFQEITFRDNSFFYRFEAPHEEWCIEPLFNGSSGIVLSTRPAPQPFVNDGANEMIFAVNLDEDEIQSITLDIYAVPMRLVASHSIASLETLGSLRGILFDGVGLRGVPLASGVYVYTLAINDRDPVTGKIAIVRR